MAFLKHDVIIQATEMSCGARAMAGASLGLKNNLSSGHLVAGRFSKGQPHRVISYTGHQSEQ